jgi:hypothetical protein
VNVVVSFVLFGLLGIQGVVVTLLVSDNRVLIKRVKQADDRMDAQNKVLRFFGKRLEAQSRYMRIGTKDRITWSAEHNRRITALEGHADTLKRAVDEQLSVTIKTAQRVNAHSRYMRTALATGERWAVFTEHRLAKLDRAGHRHEEMRTEKPKYHVYIPGKDMPPLPPRT